MPNTPVRAAAEGMPEDPIIAAIQAYRDGNAAFCAIKEADWPANGGEEATMIKRLKPAFSISEMRRRASRGSKKKGTAGRPGTEGKGAVTWVNSTCMGFLHHVESEWPSARKDA